MSNTSVVGGVKDTFPVLSRENLQKLGENNQFFSRRLKEWESSPSRTPTSICLRICVIFSCWF